MSSPSIPSSSRATPFHIGVALALVYVIWGSTYLAIRYAVETIPTFLLAAIRFLIAGAVMYGWLRFRGASNPSWRQWRSAAVIGLLLLVGGNATVVWAERTVPSGLAALLVSVVPLWIVFFDWVRPNGQRPQSLTVLGLVMGLAGLILLIGPKNFLSPVNLGPGLIPLLLAPVAWGLGSVYSKQAPLPSSPFMSTAIEMFSGGVLLLIGSFILGEPRALHGAAISATSVIALAYLTFIGALVGFSAYIYLLKNASLPVASTYAYVNPLVAVLLGWAIAGETLTNRSIAGGIVILVSVILISRARDRQT